MPGMVDQEVVLLGREISLKKSFVKKSNFQTVIFAIIFMAMIGQTYIKLFKKHI